MARIKLGEAVTDSNGIAVFEYTGTGSGLMDVRAVNGDVQSEPYPVYDTIFYDKALSGDGNHNDNYKTHNATLTRGANYSIFSNDTSSFRRLEPNIDSFTGDFAVEFRYYKQGTNSHYALINSKAFDLKNDITNTECDVKITVINGVITIYENGVANPSTQSDTAPFVFRFQLNPGNTPIGFKDLRLYPI